MRIRFALLLVLVMVAVSACGPKYVGQTVDVQRVGAVPMVLGVGESSTAIFPHRHFTITYNITRSGQGAYTMHGVARPVDDISLGNGNFYLLLIKDGVVVDEHSLRSKGWDREGFHLATDFESTAFDHVLATYSIMTRRRH
ncbi:hypothetical protein V6C53_15165 [Desulfocurvibacter africanus]|uniref:hypothetical protein n=1 Tax=Desulfocurvibacter africanus TaxID=873 RepID=UPI002FD92058